jgi:hypothetical protein
MVQGEIENRMKYFPVAVFMLLSCALAQAQGAPAQEFRPGIAGHPDCKAYFGVMWLDGVPAGQTQQATHYGLSERQSAWWQSEGNKKARGLCYLPLRESEGKTDVQCPGCVADWSSRFRWVVFEHIDDKDKRSHVSGPVVTGPTGAAGAANSSRPTTAVSVSDPKSRVDYEVAIVATGAAVYASGNPIRPPSGQDSQLFYHSEEKDKSSKDPAAQVTRNDQLSLQAAAQFIVKNAKR